jgi:hypothetical protein
MKCQEALKLVCLHVSEDLDDSQAALLNEHLSACADCRRALEQFRHSRSILRLAGDDATLAERAPEDFIRSVSRAIRLEEEGRAQPRWALPIPALARMAALVVLAVGVGVVGRTFLNPGQTPTQPGNLAVTSANESKLKNTLVQVGSNQTMSLEEFLKAFQGRDVRLFFVMRDDPKLPPPDNTLLTGNSIDWGIDSLSKQGQNQQNRTNYPVVHFESVTDTNPF